MGKFKKLLLLSALACMAGCTTYQYDNYVDDYRAKPEGTLDYFSQLAPSTQPENPTESE